MSDRRVEELRGLVETGIPFLKKVAVAIDEITPERVRLRFPHDPANSNYIGTTHAGAIFTFGETCAGVAAGAAFDLTRVRMVARRAEIEYRKAVTGELTSEVEIPAGAVAEVMGAVEREGRATLPVRVTMQDSTRETAAEMTVEYHFRKAS